MSLIRDKTTSSRDQFHLPSRATRVYPPMLGMASNTFSVATLRADHPSGPLSSGNWDHPDSGTRGPHQQTSRLPGGHVSRVGDGHSSSSLGPRPGLSARGVGELVHLLPAPRLGVTAAPRRLRERLDARLPLNVALHTALRVVGDGLAALAPVLLGSRCVVLLVQIRPSPCISTFPPRQPTCA